MLMTISWKRRASEREQAVTLASLLLLIGLAINYYTITLLSGWGNVDSIKSGRLAKMRPDKQSQIRGKVYKTAVVFANNLIFTPFLSSAIDRFIIVYVKVGWLIHTILFVWSSNFEEELNVWHLAQSKVLHYIIIKINEKRKRMLFVNLTWNV